MVDYFVDTTTTAPTDDNGGTVSIITFGNDLLRASVTPSLGANLSSVQFKRLDGSDTWLETIHRANDFRKPDGDNWEGKTPVLFPAVGRNFKCTFGVILVPYFSWSVYPEVTRTFS